MDINKDILEELQSASVEKSFNILASVELKNGKVFDNVILENYQLNKRIFENSKIFFEENDDPFSDNSDLSYDENEFDFESTKLILSDVKKIKKSPFFITKEIYKKLGDFTERFDYYEDKASYFLFVGEMSDGKLYNFIIEEIMDYGNFLSMPNGYYISNIVNIYRNSYCHDGKIHQFTSMGDIENLNIDIYINDGYETFNVDLREINCI